MNQKYFSLIILFNFFNAILCNNDKNEFKKGVNNEYSDIYFEVVKPSDVSYTYRIRPANSFGSAFEESYKNIELVPAVPFDGCSIIDNIADVSDKIALVQRGQCSFVTKAINCENAGALAVIIMDNDHENDRLIDMIDDDTNRIVNIPVSFLPWRDGNMIKSSIEYNELTGAIINIPLNVTFKNIHHLKKAPWAYCDSAHVLLIVIDNGIIFAFDPLVQ